jgi:hypothetical protein
MHSIRTLICLTAVLALMHKSPPPLALTDRCMSASTFAKCVLIATLTTTTRVNDAKNAYDRPVRTTRRHLCAHVMQVTQEARAFVAQLASAADVLDVAQRVVQCVDGDGNVM